MQQFFPSLWRPLRLLTTSLFIFIAPVNTWAQNADHAVTDQFENIQRQEAQQERFEHLKTIEHFSVPPLFKKESASPPTEINNQNCLPIKTIIIKGAKLLSDSVLQQTIAPWSGRCLDIAAINQALKAVTLLYVNHGYIAARAYLAEQNLSGGRLTITIVEGHLEDITINGTQGAKSEIIAAFPRLINKPINLRDIEQGLDQINRLDSRQATISFSAGRTLGSSILDLQLNKTKPWFVTLSSDNLGGKVTGVYQPRLNITFDNLLGSNDQWSLSYQRSMDHVLFYISPSSPNSNTITGSFSIPYGYWTAGADGTWSQYRSSIKGQLSLIDTSGKSFSIVPWISRVIHRDQVGKTWLTSRLTWKYTDNFIMGSRVDVSSRTLTIATFALNHSRLWAGGKLSFEGGIHKGLAILNAYNDSAQTAADTNTPKGQFSKFTASLSYARSFASKILHLRYNSLLSGQWSPDTLFGSEQISLGGYGSVRGVKEALYYSNSGLFWRNEMALLLPTHSAREPRKFFGKLEPYTALDLGIATDNSAKNNAGGSLAGMTFGLRTADGAINADISYSHIIAQSKSVEARNPYGVFQIRTSLNF